MPGRIYLPKHPITAVIVNLITGSVIELVHIPEEVEEANSSSFSEVNIQGRSSPILGYEGSGPRTVSFTIQLHDDYCPEGIVKTVQKLKALTYPYYAPSLIRPPKCYVRLGNFLKIIGVCNDVSVNWKKPYRDGVFIYADVSLSFKGAVEFPFSADEVEGGRD